MQRQAALPPDSTAPDGSVHACVLVCGHIEALALLEPSYTGPLAEWPRLAACKGAPAPELRGARLK
jgi:hypothetical protein